MNTKNSHIIRFTIVTLTILVVTLSCASHRVITPKTDGDGRYYYVMDGKRYTFPYRQSPNGKDREPVIFDKDQAVAQLGDKFGVIRRDGKVIIPFKYDWISSRGENGFQDQYLIKVSKVDGSLLPYHAGGMTGIANDKGEILVKPKYIAIFPSSSFGLMLVNDGTEVDVDREFLDPFNGHFGYINRYGKVVVPCIYDGAFPTFEENGTT